MLTGTDWKVATKILYPGRQSRNVYGKYAIVYLEYNLHWVTNNADLQLLDLNHAMYFSKMVIYLYDIILITQTASAVWLSKQQYYLIGVRL